MSLESITKKVVSYCEIPEELTDGHWLSENNPDSYASFTLDINFGRTAKISKWIIETYPELKEGDNIFIHIDY